MSCIEGLERDVLDFGGFLWRRSTDLEAEMAGRM